MADFAPFGKAVAKQFELMSKSELFIADIDGDALYAAYQAAFPPGTNEMFRKAREHECSCCRNFIKNIGNVVAIKDGTLMTVWDNMPRLDYPYNIVATNMANLVGSQKIKSIFRAEMPSYGAEKTAEPANENNNHQQILWNHFHGKVDRKHYAGKEAAARIGDANANAQVFRRGMEEITRNAIEDVHGLLVGKNLYRGEEFAYAFGEFVGMHGKYTALPTERARELFIWENMTTKGARLRNTAFGTLLVDLSGIPERVINGETIPAKEPSDLESAVKTYEAVMAPANYKRPNALITPRMVQDAMKTIEELGVEPALHRRMARLSDVNINDILFVDNEARQHMKGGVAGLLMDAVKKQRVSTDPGKTIDISIDDFIKSVLPQTTSLAVMVRNSQKNNFVTLTAPQAADAPRLFKWDNGFAWSYANNVTDSIQERVKAQGGAIAATMRVSLAWFNPDDLDLHVIEPNGYEIAFTNKGHRSPNTGMLDVDMNAWGPHSDTEPVENVTWTAPKDGKYQVIVENYNKRSTDRSGFVLQIESANGMQEFSWAKSPSSGQRNNALVLTVKDQRIVDVQVSAGGKGGSKSEEIWGVHTEQFTKVNTMMLSPNHWGDQAVGNKHFIFVLDGCKNPVPTRGIYNEFLKPELEKHRKVFEVLGNKTMCEPTDDQLSGVGFSSTRGDTVTVQVNGGRTYNIKF